jgi:hypothetical protein
MLESTKVQFKVTLINVDILNQYKKLQMEDHQMTPHHAALSVVSYLILTALGT